MMASLLKKLVSNQLKNQLREKLGVPSQERSFKNISRLGFTPKLCLDIGAYEGLWTQDFKQLFPECGVLMVEGQTLKEPVLVKVKQTYKDVDYKIVLLGATELEVTFNIYDTASSILTEHHDTNAKTETRKLLRLDDLLANSKYKQPDFIKIDTQGYELEILKGGLKTLSHAEFVLLEVSFLDIYVNGPLAVDVINFMKENSFVIYDICTLMKRPLDNALFQADILFVKEQSKFRSNKHWS